MAASMSSVILRENNAEKIRVVAAHYDHVGIQNGDLQLAQTASRIELAAAVRANSTLKKNVRSIISSAFDGEEWS